MVEGDWKLAAQPWPESANPHFTEVKPACGWTATGCEVSVTVQDPPSQWPKLRVCRLKSLWSPVAQMSLADTAASWNRQAAGSECSVQVLPL